MTQEDWTKMNKESHYNSLIKQDTANRKLIKKLQLEKEALKKQLSINNVSQQRELLLAFLEFYHNPKYNTVNTTFSEDVDMFLANNCG